MGRLSWEFALKGTSESHFARGRAVGEILDGGKLLDSTGLEDGEGYADPDSGPHPRPHRRPHHRIRDRLPHRRLHQRLAQPWPGVRGLALDHIRRAASAQSLSIPAIHLYYSYSIVRIVDWRGRGRETIFLFILTERWKWFGLMILYWVSCLGGFS